MQAKKTRDALGLFPVEGPKLVQELLQSNSWQVEELYATPDWSFPAVKSRHPIQLISEDELRQISGQPHPNKVYAVVKMPASLPSQNDPPVSGLHVLLDQIQDPGNLGTMIRIADWFGVSAIYCSLDTVDCFNPKVVQSTMGSLFRLTPVYRSLFDVLMQNAAHNKLPVYATQLHGENLFSADIQKDALVIFGNESRGIHPTLGPFISKALLIPSNGKFHDKAESLNVAIAAGIVCAEWARKF